jgi:hypothetical protein
MENMNFPTKEGDVIILANEIANGLTAGSATYPAPPVESTDLNMFNNTFKNAQNAMAAAQAAVKQAADTKLIALQNLVEAMKKDIQYAETTVGNDDAKLKIIGWGARREKTPLAVPGQTLELTAAAQGAGWVELAWYAPADGGKVAAYKVQRRLRPDGPWTDVMIAMETQCRVENQERLKEWEWQIVAANKAGDGMPSNIVMTVL